MNIKRILCACIVNIIIFVHTNDHTFDYTTMRKTVSDITESLPKFELSSDDYHVLLNLLYYCYCYSRNNTMLSINKHYLINNVHCLRSKVTADILQYLVKDISYLHESFNQCTITKEYWEKSTEHLNQQQYIHTQNAFAYIAQARLNIVLAYLLSLSDQCRAKLIETSIPAITQCLVNHNSQLLQLLDEQKNLHDQNMVIKSTEQVNQLLTETEENTYHILFSLQELIRLYEKCYQLSTDLDWMHYCALYQYMEQTLCLDDKYFFDLFVTEKNARLPKPRYE